MGQIIAWQCDNTKEVFLDKQVYISHLRKYAAIKRANKKREDTINKYYAWLDAERSKIMHADDIVPWLMINQQYIMDSANILPGMFHFNDKFIKGDEFTNLTLNLSNFAQQSNSHVSPRNKPTNWCGMNPDLPKHYPGWACKFGGILLRKSHKGDYPGHALFKAVGIYLESGGGGNEDFSFSGKMFAEEWPGLAETETVNKLRGVK